MTSRFPAVADYRVSQTDLLWRHWPELGFFCGTIQTQPDGPASWWPTRHDRLRSISQGCRELLNQTSARSKVATSPEADKPAKREISDRLQMAHQPV